MALTPEQRMLIMSTMEATEGMLSTYWTEGGTYMVASAAFTNDDDEPHDLVAVDRFGKAIAISPLANPELVLEVQAAIEMAIQRHAAATHEGENP